MRVYEVAEDYNQSQYIYILVIPLRTYPDDFVTHLFCYGATLDIDISIESSNLVKVTLGNTFSPQYISDMHRKRTPEPYRQAQFEKVEQNLEVADIFLPTSGNNDNVHQGTQNLLAYWRDS
jgi:hypothetical protein